MRRGTPLTATIVAFVLGALLDVAIGATPFPGYAASIGLVGCVLIVLGSKWLGKAFLLQPEGFYPEDTPADTQEDLRG